MLQTIVIALLFIFSLSLNASVLQIASYSEEPTIQTFTDTAKKAIYYIQEGDSELKRYSFMRHSFMSPIELIDIPDAIQFDDESQTLYTYYKNDGIYRLPLQKGPVFLEEKIINQRTQATISAFAVTGDKVIVRDSLGAWGSFLVYSNDGALLDSMEWAYPTDHIVWNTANSAFYFVSNYSPRDFVWQNVDEDGILGEQNSSPYHQTLGWSTYFTIALDGELAAFESGRIASTETGLEVDSVPVRGVTQRHALFWLKNTLFTVDEMDGQKLLRRFDKDFEEVERILIEDDLLAVNTVRRNVVMIVKDNCNYLRFISYTFDTLPESSI